MVDRFWMWLGAGMVTAGVAAAMVAGAGMASADSPPGSDATGTTSSESAKPTESKADSDTDGADAPEPKPSDEKPKEGRRRPTPMRRSKTDEDRAAAHESEPDVQQPSQTVKETESDTAEKLANQPGQAGRDRAQARRQADGQARGRGANGPRNRGCPGIHGDARRGRRAAVVPTSRNAKTAATPKTAATQTAAVAFAAPASAEITSTAAAPPMSGLLSAIGTIVFNLYGLATRLVGGPPILPAEQHGHGAQFHAADLTAVAMRGTRPRCRPTGTSRTPPSRRRD